MRDEQQNKRAPEDESTISYSPPDSEPERIGPYKILQKLGEGGMGIVYLAEQEKPIRRRVALKLIKLGMDTKAVIARFEAERQALALMNHPSVAKVFDAGATEQGRPYFVMEYVKGVPITEHCDRHRLTTTERLELFMQACEGVQHAHQKGVIHRDLKPSNVLVAIEGNKAASKLIDFGVAKATEQRLTEHTVFTHLGQLIGTPEYMSPEQAEMTNQDIDTRTDVYSLGVVLYELLVGALPFDPKELRRAGFDEIRRKIREDEPSRPSTRLTSLGEAATGSATNRHTDSSSLARQIRGDLDRITMMALAKERTRRYGSPNELAADIRRHLRHQPVLAGPPGVFYRLGKFLRRHRTRVVIFSFVVLFVALTLVSFGEISRMRSAADKGGVAAARLEESAAMGALTNWEFLEPRERTDAQAVIDRIATRILAGEATPQDRHEFARSMISVQFRGRSLQAKSSVAVGLKVSATHGPTADELGAVLTQELTLNGQSIQWSSDVMFVGFNGGWGSASTAWMRPPDESGRYALGGMIRAQLIRAPARVSVWKGTRLPREYQEFVGDPVLIPIPAFEFVAIEELPDTYPTLVRDSDLAAEFADAVEVGPCVVTKAINGHYEAWLQVLLPHVQIPTALQIAMRCGDGERSLSVVDTLIHPHLSASASSVGQYECGTSESGDGVAYRAQFFIPKDTVDDTFASSGRPECEMTIRSSRTVALQHFAFDQYLEIDMILQTPIEFGDTPEWNGQRGSAP